MAKTEVRVIVETRQSGGEWEPVATIPLNDEQCRVVSDWLFGASYRVYPWLETVAPVCRGVSGAPEFALAGRQEFFRHLIVYSNLAR